ncbi:MAG TPA: TIM-barrel domain-containing protein [Solimonas sp.]|nr:TIM-barrel domain-containing protein [Solimonas sp.]
MRDRIRGAWCLPTCALLLAACGHSNDTLNPPNDGTPPQATTRLETIVQNEPFALTIRQDGVDILKSLEGPALPVAPDALPNLADLEQLLNLSGIADLNGFADLSARYGSLAFAVDLRAEAQLPLISYGAFVTAPVRWFHATRAEPIGENRWRVATDDPLGRTFELSVQPQAGGGVAVEATLSDMRGVTALGWSFGKGADERFLGFGERSDGVDQTGRLVENWAEEGPFSAGALRPLTEPLLGQTWQTPYPISGTNFPIPWFLSSKGYGFMLDSYAYSAFRLHRSEQWNVETRENRIRFLVFGGPTPAQALSRFVAHNGRQPAPAEWFFGPWYQPLGTTEFRRELITNWREWDVPVTVSQTYAHYLPCAAQSGRRDALREENDYYHRHGYRVTTYVNSFVCRGHPGGADVQGDSEGYFIKTAAGGSYPLPYIAYPDAISYVVDFTNPAAIPWWQGLITEALEDGYDGWMEDFGEYVPPDAVMHDGSRGLQHHNEYCTRYHRASHELTWPLKGVDFAQFVRCGNLGTAPYARIVWGGDPSEDDSRADGLGAAVSQGLSMGLSGIAYWGSDIGGFHSLFTGDRTSADTLIRWIEFGALSGVMRMQEDGYELPYLQGERVHIWEDEVLPSWRRYTKLRTQLFPYIWNAAQEYQRTGLPIMRHLALAYPQSPEAYSAIAEYEYLFGPDLLVAPVIEEGARSREVWLPPGRWCEFWPHVDYDETSGAYARKAGAGAVEGGRMLTAEAPLEQIPMFVRAGAAIPLLPAETDTLTNIGTAPGLVELDDVRGRVRMLSFGPDC